MKINEDRFIGRVIERLGFSADVVVPPGDDCAAIRLPDGRLQLLAVDQVVADVHYHGPDSESPTTPELAGRKLLARNLSDIAAMGGVPRFALVCLAAPPAASEEWLLAFMDGLADLAEQVGVQIIGGDLGQAGQHVGSLTIIGEVAAERVLLRDRARPGDRVLVTGSFGGSLDSGRHLQFQPRIVEGQWLSRYARCAIDASDGLLKDLGRIAQASDVSVELDLKKVPVHADSDLRGALLDGEDYELILTLPEAQATEALVAWPHELSLTCIGTCLAASEARPVLTDADGEDLLATWTGGWDHFG